jgi:hypothetical protein
MAQKKSSQGSRPSAKKGASRPPAKTAGSRPAAKKKRKEPEPTPVVGGRFIIAAVIVALMVFIPMSTIGNLFQKPGPSKTDTSTWRKGNTSEVRITLVTADYNNLACASDKTLGGVHCGYKAESEPWPKDPSQPIDDNKKSIIQPYRTWPDNQLILVAGLWATPAVAMRLHDEPSAGVEAKKLARFVATCKVRFLGQLDGAKLHWTPGGKWLDQGRATVARALSCTIGEEE